MMTKAEMEALRDTINATPGYECCYHSEHKTDAGLRYTLVVKAWNHISGGCVTFPVRSAEDWERKRQINVFQPVLLPTAEKGAGA